MEILIFKTNISTQNELYRIEPVLSSTAGIITWSVDREDIDNVLRVEAENLGTEDVIEMVKKAGFFCEELPD